MGGPVQPVFNSPSVDGFLDSYCAFKTRCGGYSSKQICILDATEYDRTWVDLVSAVAAGTIVFRQDVADRCASLAINVKCTVANYLALLTTCFSAFEGTIAEGSACQFSYECANNAECEGACHGSNCCLGKCGPPRPKPPTSEGTLVPEGWPCSPDGLECELMTSYCEPQSRTCQPRPKVGDKCEYFFDSYSILSCPTYATCSDGVCRKKAEPGEPCVGISSDPCQAGSCDPATSRCMVQNPVTSCF